MKKLLVYLPLALVLTPGPLPADDERIWGAIVLNEKQDPSKPGFSIVRQSREMAISKAVDDCEGLPIMPGPGESFNFCNSRGVVSVKSTAKACMAVAYTYDAWKYRWAAGWGFSDSYQQAKKKALDTCKRNGRKAQIVLRDCGQFFNKWGKKREFRECVEENRKKRKCWIRKATCP